MIPQLSLKFKLIEGSGPREAVTAALASSGLLPEKSWRIRLRYRVPRATVLLNFKIPYYMENNLNLKQKLVSTNSFGRHSGHCGVVQQQSIRAHALKPPLVIKRQVVGFIKINRLNANTTN